MARKVLTPRRVSVVAVTVAISTLSMQIGWAASSRSSGHVRAVVVLLGDSNETIPGLEIANALLDRPDGYALVNIARPGSTIRTADCASDTAPCSTYDFWQTRVADLKARVRPEAYVIDLGINETSHPGRATGPGYAHYDLKIDWLLAQLGKVPVYWSNLPCKIEPPNRAEGCTAVDRALAAAPTRHHNLTVIDWADVANGHREYLGAANTFWDIHLTDAGGNAWADLVARDLDARFPPE